MTARYETTAATADPALFDDDILALDVVDTIRHTPSLASGDTAAALKAHYEGVGIIISDAAVAAGLAAINDNRFVHTPRRGPGTMAARLYISRRRWAPATITVVALLAVLVGGYYLAYRPWQAAQARQAQIELAQTMPQSMDALFETIHEETKVQQAENQAATIRDRGKQAAAAGDRAGAQQAIGDLTDLRDTLRAEYQLKIADQADGRWGFWTFPHNNSEATNYYLVVHALDANGQPLTLPIRSDDTGRTERVTVWAERVPEEVYRAVEADRNDDGIIQHDLLAVKEFGFLNPSYMVQTLGSRLTRW